MTSNTYNVQTISIIGSGNVATHLSFALKKALYSILEVHSANFEHASELANKLDATPIKKLEELSSEADLFIISVSDQAYPTLAEKFPHRHKPMVHTSGSIPINALGCENINVGCFYPLQTFSKTKTISLKDTPILVNANTQALSNTLCEIAHKLSHNVKQVSDLQRKQLHIAAVFACNFTNHMYAIAKTITDQHQLDFQDLAPLIQETVDKALLGAPAATQTGPASRGDKELIDTHLQALQASPTMQEIYRIISRSIQKQSDKISSD